MAAIGCQGAGRPQDKSCNVRWTGNKDFEQFDAIRSQDCIRSVMQDANKRGEHRVYVMKAHAGRDAAEGKLRRLSSGMSGVNILPKARTGQLPLALAERPLDRNGAVKGPPALSTGPQGSDYCPS
jgi:hypothetical protein